ncbi:MAG: heme biosynthesis protein HemY [Rhodospirillales bacterium]|nr:MAG: heme biosynthesis protein HemY [Rhodospirillales bacterium]
MPGPVSTPIAPWPNCGCRRSRHWRRRRGRADPMLRWGLFLIVIGVVALVAGWLAGHPGVVTLEWQDYRIDTSAAVLLAAVLVFAALVALLYRLWWSVLSAPKWVGRIRRDRRRRHGYSALSRGLVAVAAGDADTARRQARRATEYLNDPPLTMLLSAQAAQMEGDEQAAKRFFEAMRDQPTTEFLGVRGLLLQAIKREDWAEALTLARRAYRLNPRSEWVTQTLYDLQKRTGDWGDAAVTLDEAVKMKLIPASQSGQEKANLYYQQSRRAKGFEALRWARRAYKELPGHVPAAVRWAEMCIAEGRHRKAAGVIEDAWQRNPAPELVRVYFQAKKADDATQKLAAARRLADFKPGHLESRLAVAQAALEGQNWGEARTALEAVADDQAPPRVCRLMAQLEEAEHGDLVRARSWLLRASGETGGGLPGAASAPPSPPPPAAAASS